jgi:hypothetical protein
LKKFSDLIRNRTRDLPAFSLVPQPTPIQRAPKYRRGRGITSKKFDNWALTILHIIHHAFYGFFPYFEKNDKGIHGLMGEIYEVHL